jgi:serine/threonine protein kinase
MKKKLEGSLCKFFSAVQYLHLQHFRVHHDIKLNNILLDNNFNAKLTDFKLSSIFFCHVLRGRLETQDFIASEVLAENEYNEKYDIWSLRIVLYVMVTSHMPFLAEKLIVKPLFHNTNIFCFFFIFLLILLIF